MPTDYEKGLAVLRLVRSGDERWVEKILQVREGKIAEPQFQELNIKAEPEVSEGEAKRALEWADAIWVSERSRGDEALIEIVERRNQKVAEIEAEFREQIAGAIGANPTEFQIEELLQSHSLRSAESDQRKAALGRLWGEINRERLLAEAAQVRRAQGSTSRQRIDTFSNDEAARRDMEVVRSWLEREERRRGGE